MNASRAAAAASASDTAASTVWTTRKAVSWSVIQTDTTDVDQTATVTPA